MLSRFSPARGSFASSKCDPVDIPRLNLSKSNFSSSEAILQGLQTWKKTDDFRATYECLVEEFLSSGNTDLAEEVCKLVNRKTSRLELTAFELQ